MVNENEIECKRKCRALIDSEWESISEFTEIDLWDYLYSMFPGITRKISDEIYREIYNGG